MANKTTNYKLTKPLESEFYDVGVQNENMDKIDIPKKANAWPLKPFRKVNPEGVWWWVMFPPEQLPNMN